MAREVQDHLLQEAIRLLLDRLQLVEAGAVKKHPSLVEPVGLEEVDRVIQMEPTERLGLGRPGKGTLEAVEIILLVVDMVLVVEVVALVKSVRMRSILADMAEAMVAMDSARRSPGLPCITQEVVVEVDGLDMSTEVSVDWVAGGIRSQEVWDSPARQTLVVAGQEETSARHHVEAVRVAAVS